jgi:hypothetical protein
MIKGSLYGSKSFSILYEDWVFLSFHEKVEVMEIIASNHEISSPRAEEHFFVGNSTVRPTLKRLCLPENGKKGNLKEGLLFYVYIHLILRV